MQYTSAAGTTWSVTALTNVMLQPGQYYLVKEAAGNAGTVDLPTPDATGSIAMSGTDGKVALTNTTTALTGSCPTGAAAAIDLVSYGSGNCFLSGATAAQVLTNPTADFRNQGGCTYTGNPAADFTRGTAAPRNTAAATHACITVSVTPSTATVNAGATQSFSAAETGPGGPISTTFTWSSNATAIATVDANGVATGVGQGTATITATASDGVNGSASLTVNVAVDRSGTIVISQIYGGGGNSGAALKNDFIELFNRSTQAVNITGWSVQYASAAGSFTQATPLSGTIQPGAYYLVQEAAGSGGTVDLPAPDATGGINMSGTAGKVLIAQTPNALGTSCPTGTVVVDVASFGSGTNCGNAAPAPSNSTADLRKNSGCAYTPDPSVDFVTGTPSPRNSASATHSCVVGPLDHVTVTGPKTVIVGATISLAATPVDANENPVVGTTVTWSSGNTAVATVDVVTGVVTGVAGSADSVTITATATANGITKAGVFNVKVSNLAINWIDISSSSTSFPPGFQTQLFATARVQQGGAAVPATFTFEAVDPQYATIATVQNTGIITGVSAPADPSTTKPGFRITATPVGGGDPFSFVTHSITIETPVSAPTSIYATNDEFGDPTAATATSLNDLLITRTQYTLSYNASRGTPNWVSYELDARQMVVGQDRCNCFTADPTLPANKQIFTSDYTSGGYDRGHMTRSADRTVANVDNATTFFLTNVVPQVGDLNQGVWAQFENALADSARNSGRAVYIITGPLYSRSKTTLTFLKNEGKVAIPDSTWKIALIGPRPGGNPFTRGNVQTWDDLAGLTLLAVNMPNVAGVRNDPWQKYLTTVDKIEEATGYDFFSLLQTAFQDAIEAGDRPPVAQFSTTGTLNEGATVTFDASASTDPDLGRTDLGRVETLTYSWSFSDGTTASGKIVTKTLADNGPFTATLTVSDVFGWQKATSQTLTVANLPPSAAFSAPTSGVEGNSLTLSLTNATDPSSIDQASLVFAFDCGSGYSTPSAASTLTCVPADNGDLTVRGKVIDKDGGLAEYTAVIHVANAAPSATFAPPATAPEGSSFTLSLANATDPSTIDAASLTFAFDCGDGTYTVASSSSTHACSTTDNGTRSVRAKVIDKDGGFAEYSGTVAITNVAPTATFTAPASVNEGTAIALSLTDAADVSSADVAAGLTFAFDCGAGYAAPSAAPTASCPTTDNGVRTVRGKVMDKDGGATEYSAAVPVNNLAPLASVAATSPTSILSGQNVSAAGTFVDPGADAPWSYLFNWGSGANTAGTLAASGATASASRQYLVAGSYTVVFSVTDKDGASTTSSFTVDVARQTLSADVNPQAINLNDNGVADIKVTLTSASFDVSTIDIASIRIGGVGVTKKNNGTYQAEIDTKSAALHFDRKEMIAAGALTSSTTELVVLGNLASGVQFLARGAVTVR